MLENAEIFVAVVETKGFSKAARKLNLSPPIITRHIAQLEKELGVRLLQRNTRQLSLTEAGMLFYESCLSLLETYAISIKHLKNMNAELIGTLKIGLPTSISHLFVTRYLYQFSQAYPELKFEIVNGNHLINLLSQGFDLIIHCGELSDSNFYCRKLGTWSKITCASQDYLKVIGTPKSPYDLKQYNCLNHYDDCDGQWKYQLKGEVISVPIQGNIRVNSSMDLKNLALSGLGIAYLPSFTIQTELTNGTLIPVLEQFQVPSLNMYVVYPSNRYLSNKIKIFIDFLSKLNMTDSPARNSHE